jgi:hypothetical protein
MAPLTNGWTQSANNANIISNDGLPYLRSNDGKTYPLRVKANPSTGNFDYYWRGGGNGFNGAGIGGDVLMFQAVAQVNPGGQVSFGVGLNNYNGFKYDNFYRGAQSNYNNKIFQKTKEELYTQSSASQRQNLDKLPAYAGYKQTAPPPAAPGAKGGTNPGPSGIGTTYDTSNTPGLENLISQFKDESNTFEGIKQFLYYPSNIGGSGQDKITITQIEYVVGNVAGALTGTLGNRELDFNSKDNPKVRTLGMVTLPIPNELSEANQTAWGEDSLSTISAALMNKTIDIVKPFAGGDFKASLGQLYKAAGEVNNSAIHTRLQQFLTVNAAASVLKLANVNVNPEAYISRVTGTAINPNLELLFNGPKLRQFGFQFKLTPRDEKEARNIRSIIKFFKKGMAPRRSTKQSLSIFLGAPNVFRIKFTSGESGKELDSVGKIKTCALQSFSANYTPDGFYAAYRDPKAGGSQPISVVINLGFAELTPIFNDEYDGDSPSVGPEFVQENAKAFISVPQPGDNNFIGPVPGAQ